MTPSRSRPFAATFAILAFLASSYFSWTLSFRALSQSPLHLTLFTTAISSFNIAILFSWIGFGMVGGVIITVSALFFMALLDLRMGHYAHHIFTLTFFLTASLGYLFARAKNTLNQLYTLRSEKLGEEINVLANDVKEKNRAIKALEEKLARYSALREVAESLSAVLSIDDISALIIEKTLKVLGTPRRVLLFLVDADKQELMLLASNAKDEAIIKTKKGDVFDRWILSHRKSLIIEDVKKDFRFPAEGVAEANGVFNSLISTSLISENKVTGVLRVDAAKEFTFSQDDLRLLDIIANLGAVAVQNSILYARTQELAIKDGLTGLKVRRFFMESFHREVKRAARKREHLSLLILDIDHFKEYNDQYGHTAGDIVLKHLAGVITAQLDEADVAGRYGGEEIAILLWAKTKSEAVVQAEKIRRLINQRPITLRSHEANVTVSIGVSTFPEDALLEEELIRVADTRLYKAKAEGRDRVCSA